MNHDRSHEAIWSYIDDITARLTALEESTCSPASPAPSDGAAASSAPSCAVGAATTGSTAPAPCATTAASTTGCTASASHASVGEPIGNGRGGADPSAAIRADPGRPKTKDQALYDAARLFCLSSRFEPDNRTQQALADAVRQLTPMREDPVHVPPPQPEKPKPAAASAWEEWMEMTKHIPIRDHQREHFNQWVAAREKAAVGEARREWGRAQYGPFPKPDAGRADGRTQYAAVNCCGYYYSGYNRPGSEAEAAWFNSADTPAKWAGTDGRVVTRTALAPKPRRAPEVVAEEIIAEWAGDQYARDRGYSRLTAIIAAAVRADRGEV